MIRLLATRPTARPAAPNAQPFLLSRQPGQRHVPAAGRNTAHAPPQAWPQAASAAHQAGGVGRSMA